MGVKMNAGTGLNSVFKNVPQRTTEPAALAKPDIATTPMTPLAGYLAKRLQSDGFDGPITPQQREKDLQQIQSLTTQIQNANQTVMGQKPTDVAPLVEKLHQLQEQAGVPLTYPAIRPDDLM